MPEIIITAKGSGSRPTEILHEHISHVDVDSEAASHRLIERIEWALGDADSLEDRYETDPARAFSRSRGSIADTAIH